MSKKKRQQKRHYKQLIKRVWGGCDDGRPLASATTLVEKKNLQLGMSVNLTCPFCLSAGELRPRRSVWDRLAQYRHFIDTKDEGKMRGLCADTKRDVACFDG